jgi:hypothetical protein
LENNESLILDDAIRRAEIDYNFKLIQNLDNLADLLFIHDVLHHAAANAIVPNSCGAPLVSN